MNFRVAMKCVAWCCLPLALACGSGGGSGGEPVTASDLAVPTQIAEGTTVAPAAVDGTSVLPGEVAQPTVDDVVVDDIAPAPAAIGTTPTDVALRAAMAGAGVTVVPTPPAQNPQLVELGQALMFDKILSGNKDVACVTCHSPSLATTDALSLSIGTKGVGAGATRVVGAGRTSVSRNAPPLFNLGGVGRLFWDGRVERTNGTFSTPAGASLPSGLDSILAAQAMFPVSNRTEMRGAVGDTDILGQPNELAALDEPNLAGHWEGLMSRLLGFSAYQNLFAQAFPGVAQDQLGFQHAANAIAAFEVDTFRALNSPFDRYVAGDDSAISEAQKRGGLLFYGNARCSQCHTGGLLSDLQFHNIAAPQIGPGTDPATALDVGRFGVTGAANDRFAFRTPMLRNVALTGPWMHSGAYTTLTAAVAHYRNPAQALRNYDGTQLRADLQGQVHTTEQLNAGVLNTLDPRLAEPIALNPGDVADIVAFLDTLTDPSARNSAGIVPTSVPSGLPVSP